MKLKLKLKQGKNHFLVPLILCLVLCAVFPLLAMATDGVLPEPTIAGAGIEENLGENINEKVSEKVSENANEKVAETVTVNLKIVTDSVVKDPATLGQTPILPKEGVSVTVPKGSKVSDVMIQAAKDNGFVLVGAESGYITTLGWLGSETDFDALAKKEAGWFKSCYAPQDWSHLSGVFFLVDGVAPDVGCNALEATDGMNIEFKYSLMATWENSKNVFYDWQFIANYESLKALLAKTIDTAGYTPEQLAAYEAARAIMTEIDTACPDGNWLTYYPVAQGGFYATADSVCQRLQAVLDVLLVPVTSLAINDPGRVYVDEAKALTATILPENATNRDVIWTISKGAEFASITGNQLLVTAAGEVVVAAEIDGIQAKPITIVASKKPIEPIGDNAAKIATLMDAISTSYTAPTDHWVFVDMAAAGKLGQISPAAKSAFIASTIDECRKSTFSSDLARDVLALYALNVDPTKLADGRGGTFSVLDKLKDNTGSYGTNWASFVLLAYDYNNTPIPKDVKWSRENLVDYLASVQYPDGGWNLSDYNPNNSYGKDSEADYTAMVLAALSKYYLDPADTYGFRDKVVAMVDKGVARLSQLQGADGTFTSYGSANSNSCSISVVALTALGIDPHGDARFIKVKDGRSYSAMDGLLSFATADNKFGFKDNKTVNAMSTEQGYRALLADTKARAEGTFKPHNLYFNLITENSPVVELKVDLRLEGIAANVLNLNKQVVSGVGGKVTLGEAVGQTLQAQKIDYVLADKLTTVAGESAGCFGGNDGWQFLVNDQPLTKALSEYLVANNDKITVYYGDLAKTAYNTEVKVLSYENGSVVLQVSALDQAGIRKVVGGAKVVWGYEDSQDSQAIKNAEYTTNAKGTITIPKAQALGGIHGVVVSKTGEVSKDGKYLPYLVRLTPQTAITLLPQVEVTEDTAPVKIEGDTQVNVAANVAKASLDLSKNLKHYPSGEKPYSTAKLPKISVSVKQADGNVILLEIPSDTTITVYDGNWTGNLELPRLTTATIDNKTVQTAIFTGVAGKEVKFSKPVRLLIPNGGLADRAGYINEKGEFKEIAATLGEDSLEAATKLIMTYGGPTEAKLQKGNDLVIWTKHFTKFVTYNEVGGGGAGSSKVAISIKDPKGKTYLSKKTYDYTSGMTVHDLLDKTGLNIAYDSANAYVKSIDGWGEFSDGPNSGWMYRVGSSFPSEGINNYVLKAEDYVEFLYTRDNGVDLGEKDYGGGGVAKPVDPLKPVPGKIFVDVPDSHWAAAAINLLAEKQILQGVSPTEFAPNANITRAEFVAILARLSGNTLNGTAKFADVPTNAWYSPCVAWAVEKKIAQGVGADSFMPNAKITREDMAVMLSNYVAKIAKTSLKAVNPEKIFADANQISAYAQKAVAEMQKAGVINGKANNNFAPRDNATRAEAAKMVAAILPLITK